MSYAIYLRKSRADAEAELKGEGETLARHEQTLLELAEAQKLSVVRIYREIVSGDTIDARPEVQKLLEEVENRCYKGVLVMDADRLARGDSVDQGIISRAFRLSGTKIITPRKTYDPTSEFDEEYFEFEMFMARREYNMIKRRIQRGRVASVKEGKYVGSVPPYGYDRVKIKGDKGYTLEPNREAETVKYVYLRYLSGKGAAAIANELDDMGIPSRSGKPWSKASITDMLKNPVYIGKIRWSYYKDVKQSVGGKLVSASRRNNDYIYVDGLHPAIIGENDFNAVQSLLKSNQKKPIKASNVLQNPFTGLIYCGLCGSGMTRLGKNGRNKYDTIKCTNRNCKCVSTPVYLVEKELLESLREWLEAYKAEVRCIKKENAEAAAVEQSIRELRSQLSKLDTQLGNIHDFLEQGVYTVELFTKRSAELGKRKTDIENKIQSLEKRLEEAERRNKAKFKTIPKAEQAIEAYPKAADAQKKNVLLKSILTRIEYSKTVPNKKGNINNANFILDVFPRIPR